MMSKSAKTIYYKQHFSLSIYQDQNADFPLKKIIYMGAKVITRPMEKFSFLISTASSRVQVRDELL